MKEVGTRSRRQFLQYSAMFGGGTVLSLNSKVYARSNQPVSPTGSAKPDSPNILFLNVDELAWQAIEGYGCEYVKTPNINRLIKKGYSFSNSYSADPTCCPARTSWQTGRMSTEHGVVRNGNEGLVPGMPDMGQWLRKAGYRTYHTGKWHVTGRDVAESYDVLCLGTGFLYGENADAPVARTVDSFLADYKHSEPFLLLCGLMNPHDICLWIAQHFGYGGELPYSWLKDELPPLPANFHPAARECEYILENRKYGMTVRRLDAWKDDTWRYYRWAYYRYVEMVDAYIGTVLDALETSPFADNTLLVFSADHGEMYGSHQLITKGVFYDESARVPLIFCGTGRVPGNVMDKKHPASGLDLLPTFCDYAGIAPPPHQRGCSLRPLLEGRPSNQWREFVPAQCWKDGRMIRTDRYKYVMYKGAANPTEQLFDMEDDPGEVRNLAYEPTYQNVLARHRQLLSEFEAGLINGSS
ncbi:MAG: sulfatase-like hydrolase/transferase [Kiritimatiellales bacterium]|nr:sulfatase-like hydrolase/transferase [Kiritimatiellales bacterium]